MIDSKELRLGNWVKVGLVYTDELSQAEQPEYRFSQIDKNDFYKSDFFMPIQLTPKILLGCGFKHDVDNCLKLGSCFYWLNTGHLQIAIGYAPLINAPCKHLHQLQNLYFALTGAELVFSDVLKMVK